MRNKMPTNELDRDKVTPLYVQIRDVLVQRINHGQFSEGKLLPSIRQLASEFGVAVFTVRQALDLLADDGIIEKQAGRGSYVVGSKKNHILPKQKRSSILFLASESSTEWGHYSTPLIYELEYTLNQAAFHLQYGPVHPELLEVFLEENIEDASGIILWSHYETVKKLLSKYELPVILYGGNPDLVDQNYVKYVVNFDGFNSITYLVRYLFDLGHSKIATIHGPTEDFIAACQLRAFEDAIAAAGLALNPDYIIGGDYMFAQGRSAMCKLLKLDDCPTAVMCHNDYMALGAIAEIASAGLQIPDDISVTGLDDIEISAYTHPPLTTARIDRTLLGSTLARLMIERLANPRKPFSVTNIEAQVQIRKSCNSPQRIIDGVKQV